MNTFTWKIGWGISNRCNMRCRFCYSRKARREPNYEQMIQKGLKFILHNKYRIDSINFGTGEPTVEQELFSLCDAIRREAPHISIGITTNGTLAEAVKDPYCLEVFKSCIDDVDISLDYGSPDEQDQSRNYKGAFDLAVRTLALCREYGKNASIVNALHKYNGTVENIDALMRLARLYSTSLRINIYRPTTDFDFVLSYERLKEILIHLIHNYEIESLADPLFASLFHAPCEAGDPVARSSFRIIPNGYITPSTYLLEQDWRTCRIDEVENIDDLHQYDSFRSILNAPLPESCRDCPLKDQCLGGVIDRRWLWYHDLSENDPYCPLRNDGDLDWTVLSGEPVFSAEKKSFVHDGYLPTLIFGPNIRPETRNRWDEIYLEDNPNFNSSEPEETAVKLGEYLPEQAKILDLGSGLGRNGLYYLKKGNEVTFADGSRIANDRLLKNILETVPSSHYRVVDTSLAKALKSFGNNSLDGILAIHVISHGSPEEIHKDYIGEMNRILKPGGVSALTLPSLNDARCQGHPAENGLISFPFESGSEKGIVHTFCSEDAVKEMFRDFEILDMHEVHWENGDAHWHLIVRKSAC